MTWPCRIAANKSNTCRSRCSTRKGMIGRRCAPSGSLSFLGFTRPARQYASRPRRRRDPRDSDAYVPPSTCRLFFLSFFFLFFSVTDRSVNGEPFRCRLKFLLPLADESWFFLYCAFFFLHIMVTLLSRSVRTWYLSASRLGAAFGSPRIHWIDDYVGSILVFALI